MSKNINTDIWSRNKADIEELATAVKELQTSFGTVEPPATDWKELKAAAQAVAGPTDKVVSKNIDELERAMRKLQADTGALALKASARDRIAKAKKDVQEGAQVTEEIQTLLKDAEELRALQTKHLFGGDGAGRGVMENSDILFQIQNTLAPTLWRSHYVSTALHNNGASMGETTEEQKEITEKIAAIADRDPSAVELIQALDDEFSGVSDIKTLDNLSDDEMKIVTMYIPVDDIQNVPLYHGTSYENYLQIVADGVIKRSNYTDFEDKKYKNVQTYFRSQTGFTFPEDSIDKPLSFCFGGYRNSTVITGSERYKNAQGYFENQSGDKLKKENLGVIFEVNPASYHVYYAVSESHFVVDSDISLEDITNIYFYYRDNGLQIREITEREIMERGVE